MGGKTSTTTQGVSIPKEVMDRYNAINARAENVAGTPFQTYSTNPADFVAQVNQQQQQGISNVNAASGAYKPYFDQAASTFGQGMQSAQPQALNVEQYMNPFQQQVIDATMRQMGQANQQAQSGALGTAISSGAFGGDRAGIAAANLANQQGLAMGSTLAGLNAQNYGQALAAAQQQQGVNLGATQADLARLMQGGQFYAGLGTAAQQAGLQGAEAQINAGTLGQQTEQAGLSALYNQFQQKNAYPFQVAQFLANIGMGTGALSGSTTTTTQPGSFFSDRRLKEDVQRIGEGDNGLPIYKYRYKGEPETHIGFMADEVEKVRPEAVGLHPTGYKTVDYDRATKAQGGVAGPYGSSAGSQPGVAGYVPDAYLPVGELMMADPSTLQQARQSLAEQLAAVANMGNTVRDLDANWQWAKDKWGGDERRSQMARSEAATGVAGGYADGGAAYLNAGLRDQNPVEKRNYLSDIVGAQEDAKRRDGLQSPGSVPQARTTGQDAADLAKVALAFMGMNRGGRTGYADGGVSDEDMRRLRAMQSGAATDILPSGLVPQPSRISSPVSYDVRPSGADVPVRTPLGTSGSYNPNTGLVRDVAGNAVTGLAGDTLRGIMTAGQENERAGLAAAMRNTAEQQATSPTAENTLAMQRARDEYLAATQTPTAGAARENFVPQSEQAIQLALKSRADTAAPVLGLGGGGADRMPVTPAGVMADGLRVVPVSDTGVAGLKAGQMAEPMGWAELAPKIKARESGGDYDALYGFSNREGGAFEGTKLTDMTVDQAIQFSDPNGPYGQWSKQQLGYVATPMGAYQIVGSTLRDIKENMGLTGDEKMTPDLQEAMAKWLYQNRGGAMPWAASEGAGPAGGGVASAGRAAPSNVPSGLAAGLAAGLGGDKAYEDRNALGKMMYDPETGKISRNALLSLASGVGAMLSSPSQYFLPSLGLGLQGAASTYAGLEKQAADVGLTKAQTAETANRAVAQAFFQAGGNGPLMVVLANGQPVTLDQYLSNPNLKVSSDPAVESAARMEAQRRAVGMPSGGAGASPAAETVFGTPTVQGYISGEARAANMNYGGAQERSASIEQGIEASAEAARASRASMLLQTDAVANLVSPNAEVRSGALGELKAQAVRYANELLRAGGYEPISGADDKQIADKAAIAASLDRASGGGQQSFEALNALLVASPNIQNEPEANAKLMATLMLAQQRAVDAAEFARRYKLDPSNGYRLVTDAPKAFDEMYRRRYLAEEGALKTLILHGYETPAGWPKTPMQYLMDQSLSAADRNEVIRKTLLSYGYTEDQIAPLTSATGTLDMARYFGG